MHAPVPVLPALVGRDRELTILRQQFDAALAGHGRLVLISGEAGIGKTALAETICREAQGAGALLLTGRCFDEIEAPAYGVWRYLFDRYARTPDATSGSSLPSPPTTFRAPGPVGEVASQMLLFQEMQDFFRALTAAQPSVLLLEDVQWSDPASLELLRLLSRSADLLALLIVVTYRSEELTTRHVLTAHLPTLIREAHAHRLDLHPLDDVAVRALVSGRYALSYAETMRLVRHLQARAEGNPLFLGELLRALEEDGVLVCEERGWELGTLTRASLPPLVRQVIDLRFARLDAESQRLLTIAAIIGHEVPLDVLALVAEADEEVVAHVVEQGLDIGVLRETADTGRVQFVHALVRETIMARVPVVRRRGIHRRVGEVLLRQRNPDPDAVASHLQQAGDDRAGPWLVAAGERAHALHAWETAFARYEAALALLGVGTDHEPERAMLHFRLSLVGRGGGKPEQALSHISEAERLASRGEDPLVLARIRLYYATLLCRFSDFVTGVPMMRAALAALTSLSPEARAGDRFIYGVDASSEHATALVTEWLAQAGYIAEARMLGEKFLANPPKATPDEGTNEVVASIRNGLGMTYTHYGMPDAAAAAFEQAHALFDSAGHYFVATGIWERLLCEVVLQYRADDRAERDRVAQRFEHALMREVDLAGNTDQTGVAWLPVLAVTGPWDDMPAHASAIAGCHSIAGLIGRVAVARGDASLLQSLMRAWLPAGLDAQPGSVRFRPATVMQRLAAEQALLGADLPAARRWLEMHDRWLAWNGAALGRCEGETLWAASHRQAGDLAAAEEHARRALAHATEPRQPLALLAVHRLLGELATDAGRYTDAASHLDTALALAGACGARYERALTILARASLDLATHDTTATAMLLDEARTMLLSLQATPALGRADALATRLDAAHRATPAYPAGLSPREVEVLRGIARGLSNSQIAEDLSLSVRTVERHMTNLYRKIAVHSKAQATAYAIRNGLS
jgi:DNA-binding CsgD family transcriptional regulator